MISSVISCQLKHFVVIFVILVHYLTTISFEVEGSTPIIGGRVINREKEWCL